MKVSNKSAAALNKTSHAKEMLKNEKAMQKSAKESTTIAKATVADPAKVDLSARAKQIKNATEIAKQSNVDEAKVARLQSLIDSGKYQVDAAKIADKLVDEHLKMPT